MNAVDERAIEDELEFVDCLIKASEDWSETYQQDITGHAQLIKLEARFERDLRRFFREKAELVEKYINWTAYYRQINADIQVETIVTGDFFDGIDGDFIQVSLEAISLATAIGAQSGERIYKIPLGIQSTDAIIQELSTDRVAFLVGKRVDKQGRIIDNPRAEYRISDKTRKDIAKSVQTSINLGEDKAMAVARLQKTIKNPARATDIAQTEIINAHTQGLLEFGRQSNATGKRSRSTGAVDDCALHAALGIVALDYLYGGKYLGPAYHNRCRCGLILDYGKKH